MIKSILLPLDGSTYSDSVIKYGKFFAEKFDAVVRILSVVDIRLFDWSMATGADSFVPLMPSADFQAESQKIQDEKADKIIEKAANILNKTSIKFEVLKTSGIPVDEICQSAMVNDLVIMGIRGEYERWSEKFLGATVESVTRQVTKPTMLVDKNFEIFKRIHCGYDGSSSSNKALQLSAYLASLMKIKLQVITVLDSEEERTKILDDAERYLVPYKIDFNLRHETGEAADVLEYAQNNAPDPALTVIGSYGHSRLREAIIGSTTVQVMRKANKPILLAK
jgi:nucleotide-binding universal stress UspA family protein